jgi:hypothetical protein
MLIGEEGQPIKRLDGGVVDEATWREVCEKLKTKPGRRERSTKALLSKKARCGLCGSGMVRIRRSDTFFMYGCRSVDSGGCAKVAISGPQLDKQITALVLAYLNQPLEAVDDKPFEGQARLDEVTDKIAELMTAYRSGDMPGSLVFPSVKELEDEQRVLQSQAAKHVRLKRKVTTAAEEWEHIGLERQQAILDEMFEAVVIMPARKDGKPGVYYPDRVKPIYRSPE